MLFANTAELYAQGAPGMHIGPGPAAINTPGRNRALLAKTPKSYTQGASGIHIGPGPAASKLDRKLVLSARPQGLSGIHISPVPSVRTAVGD
jgi:hypothetical protein